MGSMDGQVELIVQNLLDEPYREFRHQNTSERRLYLRLTMDFD